MTHLLSCACFAPKVLDDAKSDAQNSPGAPDRKSATWLQRFRTKFQRNVTKEGRSTTGTKRVRVRNHV